MTHIRSAGHRLIRLRKKTTEIINSPSTTATMEALMRFRRLLVRKWYVALAVVAATELGSPNLSRAGQITVTENLPRSGFTTSFTLGAGVTSPLSPGQSYSVGFAPFKTPDGQFEVFINNISATDPNGFPSITGSLTIDNLKGGEGSLFVDIKQAYVPNAIFNTFCYDGAALVGSFTESAPHGNNVVGVGIVGGGAFPPVSATDFAGAQFNPSTGYFLLPSPKSFEAQVTFNFAQGSQAGDLISIPFTIMKPSLTSVPEPASWVMASTAALGGMGFWSNRRRRMAS